MAEINAKDLTAKTSPASTDSMLLFGTTSNEGAKITVDNLADNILGRLATKTFPNQVGGSSAATILAQLATLNSNLKTEPFKMVTYASAADIIGAGYVATSNDTPYKHMYILTLRQNNDALQIGVSITSAGRNKLCWRACNSGTWGSWYETTGTVHEIASTTATANESI